jgi:hypothetical protein
MPSQSKSYEHSYVRRTHAPLFASLVLCFFPSPRSPAPTGDRYPRIRCLSLGGFRKERQYYERQTLRNAQRHGCKKASSPPGCIANSIGEQTEPKATNNHNSSVDDLHTRSIMCFKQADDAPTTWIFHLGQRTSPDREHDSHQLLP